MITKEEAKNKLRKAGYSVVEENSVITILISEKASIKNTVKSVKELLLKMDYQASFGVKQHSSNGEEETAEDAILESVSEYEGTDFDSEIENSETYEEAEVSTDGEEEIKTASAAKTKKRSAKKTKDEPAGEDDFLDEEDENLEELDKIKLDEFDMDMMLSEDSVQFSLEDFGLM